MSNTGDSGLVDGCNSGSGPDYDSIELPAEPATEYSYTERRAEILQLVRQAGHPASLNQTELADRYGVTQQQISKDLDRLAEYCEENLGSRRFLVTESVVHRSIRGLLEEGEYRKAAKTSLEWSEWVCEERRLDEIEERLSALEERQNQSGGFDL